METATVWTVESVKAECPRVRVLVGNRESWGYVKGRTLPFARIACDEFPASVECAWETVVHCLNNGRPVRL